MVRTGSNDFARRWHCARGPTIIQPCKSRRAESFPAAAVGFGCYDLPPTTYGGSKTDGRGGLAVHIYILNGYLYTGTVVKTYRDRAHISGFSGSARNGLEKPESFIFPHTAAPVGFTFPSDGN